MKKRLNSGEPYIFATSMGMLLTLVMVFSIVIIILFKGLGFFWPSDIVSIKMKNGHTYMGELNDEQVAVLTDNEGKSIEQTQLQLKIGNRDLYGRDFIWISARDTVSYHLAGNVMVLERTEYGNFYGYLTAVSRDGKAARGNHEMLLDEMERAHDMALEIQEQIEKLESDIANLTDPVNKLLREISLLQHSEPGRTETGLQQLESMKRQVEQMQAGVSAENDRLNAELLKLYDIKNKTFVVMTSAEGTEKQILLANVVRYYTPNEMNGLQKAGYYITKLWEFISAKPRESNTEGGVFPAIYGTVLMVILMSIFVVPLGVLAAIYLNEYAHQGIVIRLIRLSVNNLAGVPSIVFGIFGLGFFIYIFGVSIDQLFFSSKLPEPTFGTGGILWASLTLALLTIPVVIVATEEGILAVPQANRQGALALGATKWQTIRDIVLPNAMPGILTGLILAISRGAGEVAPLMITGVVKLAPSLPLDTTWPFLHLDQKFMHLGFHIYDVGFQSPNVEAAKPMVYMTAILLILIVIVLNIVAIYLRNRLRKRFKLSAF